MMILYPDDFPAGFVRDCSHAGACDVDVAYWLDQIGLAVSPAEAPREPEACDNLSLDRVAGLAQALGLGIDETRRLLAANQPEDWQA